MRVLVAANLTPFLRGGAQEHIRGLTQALRDAGHSVECLELPFVFNPYADVSRALRWASELDMSSPSGQSIDRLIGLQFPAYGVRHPHRIGWVMHQHRAVYDLYKESNRDLDLAQLRDEVHAFDMKTLKPLAESNRLFANSNRVAERLRVFNGLRARPLYHPPPMATHFFCKQPKPYIFYPSRFESLKRQNLVIEAMLHVGASLQLVLAGDGGQFEASKSLASRLELNNQVHFLGRISQSEKIAWMANSLAVVYPPLDEDYGYVTLEAMLSEKPVITCHDSGGPLEFVQHENTGLIVSAEPQAIAEAFNKLAANPQRSIDMGKAARAHYEQLGITWSGVVEQLLTA